MLDTLAAIVKALLYGAALSCAGAIFATATLRTADSAHIVARVARFGAAAVIAAAFGGALLLLLRLGGQFDSATIAAVFSSSAGAALFAQIAGALLLLTSADDPTAHGARLGFAILITLSFAFSGHAAVVGPFESLFVFVHATAAAWWIGSLWLLRAACMSQELAEISAVLGRFTVLATRVIGVLGITGLLLIYVLVDFEALPRLSAYEGNLMRKLILVIAVLALASYNKFRLTPRLLNGDVSAKTSLRRSIDIELLIIAGVLIATAVTTTFTSPHM